MQFTEGLFILKKSPIPKIFGDDKMIATILTATAVYVATGIDYLVILILLFSQVKKRSGKTYLDRTIYRDCNCDRSKSFSCTGGCKFNSSAMGYRTTWTFTTLPRRENMD